MDIYHALAVIIGIALAAGIVHVLRSRRRADALLAAQLAGTCSVGVILLIGPGATDPSSAFDLALIAALLASLTAVAFAALGWPHSGDTAAGADDERQ